MQSQHPIGQPFIELLKVESTNNYATGQVQAQMAEHGTTWFAHEQTKGKGQRGKSWKMEPGQNIIVSTIVAPTMLQPTQHFMLNTVVALACYDFFSKYAGEETTIKWPNDLYWKDRKAGGILIENILQGNNWKFAVVGIGININQTSFPPEIPNPVSLKQVTGRSYDCVALAKDLCACLELRWQQLISGNDSLLLNEYTNRLYRLNTTATFKKDNAVFNATVRGVDAHGRLLVNKGYDTAVEHGEWEWVIN